MLFPIIFNIVVVKSLRMVDQLMLRKKAMKIMTSHGIPLVSKGTVCGVLKPLIRVFRCQVTSESGCKGAGS